MNTVSKKFNFCENDYNLAVNTHFWTWSNSNIFANFGSLWKNDGTLQSSHQGGSIYCHLAGGKNNYKNNYLLRANRQYHFFMLIAVSLLM